MIHTIYIGSVCGYKFLTHRYINSFASQICTICCLCIRCYRNKSIICVQIILAVFIIFIYNGFAFSFYSNKFALYRDISVCTICICAHCIRSFCNNKAVFNRKNDSCYRSTICFHRKISTLRSTLFFDKDKFARELRIGDDVIAMCRIARYIRAGQVFSFFSSYRYKFNLTSAVFYRCISCIASNINTVFIFFIHLSERISFVIFYRDICDCTITLTSCIYPFVVIRRYRDNLCFAFFACYRDISVCTICICTSVIFVFLYYDKSTLIIRNNEFAFFFVAFRSVSTGYFLRRHYSNKRITSILGILDNQFLILCTIRYIRTGYIFRICCRNKLCITFSIFYRYKYIRIGDLCCRYIYTFAGFYLNEVAIFIFYRDISVTTLCICASFFIELYFLILAIHRSISSLTGLVCICAIFVGIYRNEFAICGQISVAILCIYTICRILCYRDIVCFACFIFYRDIYLFAILFNVGAVFSFFHMDIVTGTIHIRNINSFTSCYRGVSTGMLIACRFQRYYYIPILHCRNKLCIIFRIASDNFTCGFTIFI